MESKQTTRGQFLVEFRFSDLDKTMRLWWLRASREEVELCLVHPGGETDLVVRASIRDLTDIWLGNLPAGEGLRSGRIRLEGDPRLARGFAEWFGISAFGALKDRVSTG